MPDVLSATSPSPPAARARVRLSRVRRGDAADLIRANQASAEIHRPWIRPFTDEAGFVAWHQAGMTGAHVNYVARCEDRDAVVAVVSFENVVAGAFWSAHLSYYGMVGFVGGGWQSESVRAALGLAFADLGLHRVEAAVQPGNLRSRKLLQRLGFRLEGVSPEFLHVDGAWRDHERWALLRREFRS